MNCDHAFDLMTDPVLDDSAALHEHLDACPRCQQMYDTLSPALGLFQPDRTPIATVVDDRETETASAVDIAKRVAVSLSQTPAPARRRRRLTHVAAYAVVGVITFSTTLGLLAFLFEPSVPVPLQPDSCTWLHRDAADETQDAQAVVRSCMTCHVSVPIPTAESRQTDPRPTVLAGLMN